MTTRKCKPADQWTQLHLFADSEREIEHRTAIEDLKRLPCLKNWKPEEFRAGVAAD